jgi:uncharacterized SAM-binding protein YcdF (DUF218 family)
MKEILEATKKKLIKYGVIATLLAAIFTWPGIIFYPMGALLYRNDHPKDNADAVWLLMGGVEVRPAAAAKAVLSKVANRVIFVTSEMSSVEEQGLMPSEQVLTTNILKSYGIDESKITVVSDFGRAASTVDEAEAMRRLVTTLSLRPKRLVVVTSWPHSARAGWIIEKSLKDTGIEIELLPVDAIPYDKSNWWKSERGMIFVFEEYIKWSRYLIKYAGRDITT